MTRLAAIKPCGGMASTLAAELVEEILLRVPPDELSHLARASLVCKAWRSILSDDTFRRRYLRFHGTPPLLGYICSCSSESTVRLFLTTSAAAASPLGTPAALNCSDRNPTPSALDCRHGRVLITARVDNDAGFPDKQFIIVWDPITDSQHHLILPSYLHSFYNHAGAVLCAKDGCDHLDCHGGPFRVVLLGMSFDNGMHTWASVYSSETGAWSARTTNGSINECIYDSRLSLFTGDALYFTHVLFPANNIIKYDLSKHELSLMDTPGEGSPIVVKGDGGGLGVAAMLHKSICMWSWKVGIEGVGEWVKCKVLELDDTVLPPKDGWPRRLIGMAEGTNTVFVAIKHTGIFMLNLKSKQVSKVGETKNPFYGLILPYMSFYTPKYYSFSITM